MAILLASSANAQVFTLVANRSAIANPQTVDWSQLGPAGTQVPQPFQATASGGFHFTVLKNNSPTNYIRADEGNGFVGDFLPNDHLLYSTSLTAFDFKFGTPVQAVGAQLQIDRAGSWTPFLAVYGTDGKSHTFVLSADVNNQSADGSAPFVGIASDGVNISEVIFDSAFGGNTAINELSISVPEPSSLVLMAAVSAGLVWQRRRWKC
jgi:hypothetical protein